MSISLRSDNVGLKQVYDAIRTPNRSSSIKLLQSIREETSLHAIDSLLRSALGYLGDRSSQKEEWPVHRLFNCLDTIIAGSTRPLELLNLPSLQACLRSALDQLAEHPTETTPTEQSLDKIKIVASAAHFAGTLLRLWDHVDKSNDNKEEEDNCSISTRLRIIFGAHQGIQRLLDWFGHCPNIKVKHHCLRALTGKARYFVRDLIHQDAYWILAGVLSNLSDYLDEDPKHIKFFSQVARLLENILQYAASKSVQDNSEGVEDKAIMFAGSVNFTALIRAWEAVCESYSRSSDSLDKLVLSMTNIISIGAALSERVVETLVEPSCARLWQNALIRSSTAFKEKALVWMRQGGGGSISGTVNWLSSLLQVALRIAIHGDINKQNCANGLLQCIAYLLSLFNHVDQPPINCTGSSRILLGVDRCSAPGYLERDEEEIIAKLLREHENLYVVTLECLIHHVQLAHNSVTITVSSRIACCLTTIISALVSQQSLLESSSGLQTRIRKLCVFFMHYDQAINVFSRAPSGLNGIIWTPTVEDAKLGLTNASQAPTPAERERMIYKSKRAFVALQIISMHPRACERLISVDILNIVNQVPIPSSRVLEQVPELVSVYALFAHFLAAMSNAFELARKELADSPPTGPIIMKLLWEGVKHTEQPSSFNSDDDMLDPVVVDGNPRKHLVYSSLAAFNAFGNDPLTMERWLSWPPYENMDADLLRSEYDGMLLPDKSGLTILPLIIRILLPSSAPNTMLSEEAIAAQLQGRDIRVLSSSAAAFENLCKAPSCVLQLLSDFSVLHDVCLAIVILSRRPSQETNTGCSTLIRQEEIGYLRRSACSESLCRGLLSLLECKETMRMVVASDMLTAIFNPLLDHGDDSQRSEVAWKIRNHLYHKRLDDYVRLFEFTKNNENVIRLHEMSAVAVAYACPDRARWASTLGVRLVPDIPFTKSVFGVLCHMLLYDLEEAEDGGKGNDSISRAAIADISVRRRYAAAQAIECLVHEQASHWRLRWDQLYIRLVQALEAKRRHMLPSVKDSQQEEEQVMVSLVAEKTVEPVHIQRSLLTTFSPYFAVMFSGQYAEPTSGLVRLRDVSYHELQLFKHVLTKLILEDDGQEKLDALLPPLTPWHDIISLLLVSDRFQCDITRNCCEAWILARLREASGDPTDLGGAIQLYRRCRDRAAPCGGVATNVWPFQVVLNACLKAIVSHLSVACRTVEYQEMVNASDPEELDAFCYGISVLMQNMDLLPPIV